MSKITPKNLHYDNTLPPFLARLQANNSSRDGRHEYDVARPKKARNAEEEAEDEPVYFDEGTGETLTKSEWEEKDKADAEEKDKADAEEKIESGAQDGEEVEGRRDEGKEVDKRVAAIGGSKKRKMGKIIGRDENNVKDKDVVEKKPPKPAEKISEKGKAAKKVKKIKLSFGADE